MTKPRLRVFAERVVDPRFSGVGLLNDRLHIIRDRHREYTLEKCPGAIESGDHFVQTLPVRRVDEHVAGIDRGEDQPVHHPFGAGRWVWYQAEPAEVDLNLGTRFASTTGTVARRRPNPSSLIAYRCSVR